MLINKACIHLIPTVAKRMIIDHDKGSLMAAKALRARGKKQRLKIALWSLRIYCPRFSKPICIQLILNLPDSSVLVIWGPRKFFDQIFIFPLLNNYSINGLKIFLKFSIIRSK